MKGGSKCTTAFFCFLFFLRTTNVPGDKTKKTAEQALCGIDLWCFLPERALSTTTTTTRAQLQQI